MIDHKKKRKVKKVGGSLNPSATLFDTGTSSIVLESEGFESGMGSWTNVTSGDSHDWTRDEGGTQFNSTGPWTGAGGSAWYMYMETSNNYANDPGNSAFPRRRSRRLAR
jgi:hypothetical protein